VCRSPDVVAATPAVSLGLLTRILAWFFALMSLRWGIAHRDVFVREVLVLLAWLYGKSLIAGLWSLISVAVTLRIFVWCIGVFNKELADRLQPLGQLLPWLVRGCWAVLVGTARLLWWVVEGRATPKPPAKGKKAEGASDAH